VFVRADHSSAALAEWISGARYGTAQPRSFNQCLGLCTLLAYSRNLCHNTLSRMCKQTR
jgi:hypothetical protein